MAAKKNPMERWEYPKRSGIWIRPIIDRKMVGGNEKLYSAFLVTIPKEVTGSKRIRKQCPSVEKAEEFASEEHRGKDSEGKRYFDSSEVERAQFAFVLPKLREAGLELTEAVEYALIHMAPSGGVVSVEALVKELNDLRKKRLKKGTMEWDTYRDYKAKSEAFAEAFPDTLLRDLLPEDIVSWLLEMEKKPRTIKNYFSNVTSVLKFAVQKDYLVKSPLVGLTDEDKRLLRGDGSKVAEPSILSVDEAEKLLLAALEHSELALLPAIILALFCGIRTTELRRLNWVNVKDHESRPIVTIPSGIAKKRRIRNVDIPENALAWLALCKNRVGRLTYSPVNDDYYKRFRRLLEHLGYRVQNGDGCWTSNWKINAMRHSFGSYHFALHENSMETSRLLGHKSSDDVLFEYYRALANQESGHAYFGLFPPKNSRKIVGFAV